MKHFNQARKFGAGLALATLASAAAQASGGPDYSSIYDGIDWTAVGTAALAIFALIGGVYAIFKGGKLVLRAIKGA